MLLRKLRIVNKTNPVLINLVATLTLFIIISLSIIFSSVHGQPSNVKSITSGGSTWIDLLRMCTKEYICKLDNTTGWKDKKSLLIIKSDNLTHPRWSYLAGNIINVEPEHEYEIKTHMKVNEWSNSSHIVIEASNKTSTQWYQLIQCPTGYDKPLDWREFKCKVTIPADVTMLRLALNAGWSSESKEEAKTWFDALTITALGAAPSTER